MENIDIKEMAHTFMSQAQTMLQTDGHLVPVCFVLTDSGSEVVALPFKDEQEKRTSMRVMADYARFRKAYALMTINDAYCATAKTKEEWESIRPGDLSRRPESERGEGIVLVVKQANGTCWSLIAEYKRVKDDAGKETLQFEPAHETSECEINMIPDFGTAESVPRAN